MKADRLMMGRAALLELEEASHLLGGEPDQANAWLRNHGLIRPHLGREVVIWGDVLTELRACGGDAHAPTWASTAEAASALGVDRGLLDPLAQHAHAVRPDAVVQVGTGKVRRTYRWRLDLLGEAVSAAQAHRALAEVPRSSMSKSRSRSERAGKSLSQIAREARAKR